MTAPKVVVEAMGNRVVLDFEDLASVLRVFAKWGTPSRRGDFARRLEESMRLMGLDLEVRVKGKILDRFGSGGEAGLLRRMFDSRACA
jgi:hypothetical protein